MPEIAITIGGRSFDVACQDGEEPFLHAAARLLDIEAQTLAQQVGRIPEARMLLMAGLMLADKTAGLEDQLRGAQDHAAALEAELRAIKDAPPPAPERVEVPVVPKDVTEALQEIAARAEALAQDVEDKTMARS